MDWTIQNLMVMPLKIQYKIQSKYKSKIHKVTIKLIFIYHSDFIMHNTNISDKHAKTEAKTNSTHQNVNATAAATRCGDWLQQPVSAVVASCIDNEKYTHLHQKQSRETV